MSMPSNMCEASAGAGEMASSPIGPGPAGPIAGRAAEWAGQRIGVDTSVFIYWIEDHAEVAPLVAPVFAMADRGDVRLVASALALMEVLVVPYRLGRRRLAERYASVLCDSPGLDVIDVGQGVLRSAARLRAATSASAPDAIHLATALKCGCRFFLTNDRRLPEVGGLRVVQVATLGA